MEFNLRELEQIIAALDYIKHEFGDEDNPALSNAIYKARKLYRELEKEELAKGWNGSFDSLDF